MIARLYRDDTSPLNEREDKPELSLNISPLFQKAEVGQQVLERYLALEDEIAQAEQNSPKMALDQKKSQVETLRAKITEQQVLVEKLEEST